MRPQLTSCLIAATLVLSACGGDGEPAADPREPSTPSASSSPTESSSASASKSESASPSPLATAESDDDAIIADLMREPGPYAGGAFDLDAVLSDLEEQDPQTAEEWTEAIADATHGDYAEATQRLLDFDPSIGDDPSQPAEKLGKVEVVGQNHFSVVLDASGSMAERAGGQPRMQQAKAAVRRFASRLPRSSTLSLRVYGHEGSNAREDKATSCAATEVVYEGPPRGVGGAMSTFGPTGWTPLAKSIQAASGDIPEQASDAIVYVVTDGLETCGGDPVKAARKLAEAGTKPVVNVIGFQVGNADQAQLRRIAKAGGGAFTDARSGADLDRYWEADRRRMMAAWLEWKREALARIDDAGRENLEEADTQGRTLLDGIEEEWDHQDELLTVLEDDETLDGETKSAVWRALYARKSALWSWSYEIKSSSWRDAYEVKTSRWSEAYELGSGTWSEYYAKAR